MQYNLTRKTFCVLFQKKNFFVHPAISLWCSCVTVIHLVFMLKWNIQLLSDIKWSHTCYKKMYMFIVNGDLFRWCIEGPINCVFDKVTLCEATTTTTKIAKIVPLIEIQLKSYPKEAANKMSTVVCTYWHWRQTDPKYLHVVLMNCYKVNVSRLVALSNDNFHQ